MTHAKTKRVGVIGGGLAGLAAACTLAARGYAVVLFEKNAWLGGKAAILEEGGYRFDMGPTIMIVPSVLARIFREAGRQLNDELDLVPLDPQWRSFFDDGSQLDLVADIEAMAQRVENFSKQSGLGDGYRRFLQHSQQLHDISDKLFFWRSMGGVRDLVKFRTIPALLNAVVRLRPSQSVATMIRSYVSDERCAQMLDHFTQYVGSAPTASPAVLCSIAHMQTSEGVWYPKGGTRAIPNALTKLAKHLGVDVRLETSVERIRTNANGVCGVETATGDVIDLGAVISNSDAVRTHRELLAAPLGDRFAKRRRYEPACSGIVLYLGLRRQYDQLLHHNFVFSDNSEQEFDAIYHRGDPAPDPTCYVCAPAKTEPDVAPPGGEALYVLVHTPYLRPHHNWQELYPQYRRTILNKLARTAGLTDLEDQIAVERWLTPQDIHERYRVLDGAIYGLASHGRLGGAFKPANRSPDVAGLYLAGGAANPGPGMPMVLMSGWIAADTLHQDGIIG